jgi:hypothetical protein
VRATAAIELAVYGGAIPAVIAAMTFFAAGWLWSKDVAQRYQAALAFAAGVFVTFLLLPSRGTLAPPQYWEWIPLLGLLAAFTGGLTQAGGVRPGERWLAICLLASLCAWLVVPKWPELFPAWPVQMATFAVAVPVVTALLIALLKRLPRRAFPIWLMMAACGAGLLILAEVSETIGSHAVLPVGALAGVGLATILSKTTTDLRALVLTYAVTVGGYSYLGAAYPMPQLWLLLVVPSAPLMLWLAAVGPLTRISGGRAIMLQAVCVLVPIAVAAAVILSRPVASGDW